MNMMDDQEDQEAAGRWDALGSRDASSREAAMEHIRQEVMRKVQSIAPMPVSAGTGQVTSDLNDVLARLLMLSKRCPFVDVKERCLWLLQSVQVGPIAP